MSVSKHPYGPGFTERRRRAAAIVWFLFAALIAGLFVAGKLRGQTQITPRQMRGLASVVVMKCAGVTATTVDPPTVSDCTGLYYVDLVAADGTELKILGTPAAPGVTIDPAHWSLIP